LQVVLLVMGLIAMGTEKNVFQLVDNCPLPTDGDNIPKERRDPPPVMFRFQNKWQMPCLTDGWDNISKQKKRCPSVNERFQYNDKCRCLPMVITSPKERRDPPPWWTISSTMNKCRCYRVTTSLRKESLLQWWTISMYNDNAVATGWWQHPLKERPEDLLPWWTISVHAMPFCYRMWTTSLKERRDLLQWWTISSTMNKPFATHWW